MTWRIVPVSLPQPNTTVSTFVGLYGSLTGAGNGYSFFAPGVASQMVVTAEWIDDKRVPHSEIHDGRKGETEMRLTAMALALAKMNSNETVGRAIAAKVLNAHPETASVTVSVSLYIIPTMREFRDGSRPREQVLFRGVYVRRLDLPDLESETQP